MVTSLIRSNDLCTVALITTSDDANKQRKAVFPQKRMALLEIGPLRQSLPADAPLRDLVLKSRLQKQALCSVGLAVGLGRCPYPRCCLLKAASYQDLDTKAVTFCPPCHGRFERIKLGSWH
jgi:predicted Zn-dependent protease